MNTDSSTTVELAQIAEAFQQLGIAAGDTALIHSSLRSFGHVIGGPISVIDAIKTTVTASGTVVFPTLVQRDFPNAYRNWDIRTTPSDVGHITEVFRLLPDSVRSDQATHSVAAWGSGAVELTAEHSAYGPRMGVFGDYCFSYSSPWQKMYFRQAKIVFIGVSMNYNTFKHFAEYNLVEHYCNAIVDPARKCAAMSRLARHNAAGVWPFHNAARTQELLEERGLISYARCGNALLTSIKANDYVDHVLQDFKANPTGWFDDAFCAWLEQYVYPH